MQEMLALKKAYADMILNISKEAAVRVMEAKIKTDKYEKDLISTKEEAVRMMMRLKQMIDNQKREAEGIILNNQRKITELEAQLDEAEGLILDLRAKLSHTEDQLEAVKDKHKRLLAQKESVYLPRRSIMPTNEQTYFAFSHSFPEPEPTEISEVQIPLAKHINLVHECVTLQKEIARISSGCDPCPANTAVFASDTTQSKEPELFKENCCQGFQSTGTVPLSEPSTLLHARVTSLEGTARPSTDSRVFASVPNKTKELEMCNNNCSQVLQAIETVSLPNPSTLVHESITSSKGTARSCSDQDPCHMNDHVFTSGTAERKEDQKNEYCQGVYLSETYLAANLNPAQDIQSLPKRDPKTKNKRRYADIGTLSCLRTDKAGMKENFGREAVLHKKDTVKDQHVKVRKIQRRKARYGKGKSASCKQRSAQVVAPQRTSIAIAQCNSFLTSKVATKSGDPPTKYKSVGTDESAPRLNEKLQLHKHPALYVVRRSCRKRKIKHLDGHGISGKKQDIVEKESCKKNKLVECQVRASDVLGVEDEGKSKEGIYVKEAFANASTPAKVVENCASAGTSLKDDTNLVDVLVMEKQDRLTPPMKLEKTYVITGACSDALEACQNNKLVECQVRACQDVLGLKDEGRIKEGTQVKEGFANAGMLAKVVEDSLCAGNSSNEDANLIEISIMVQQDGCLVTTACSDAGEFGQNKELVESQVRTWQDVLEVECEGENKEGIHVKRAKVEDNSTHAGNSLEDDTNLIDIPVTEQDDGLALETAYLVTVDCSDSNISGRKMLVNNLTTTGPLNVH